MNVDYFKELIVDALQANTDISDNHYVGFGSGVVAAALGDTALGTEFAAGAYARLDATQGEGAADTYKLTGVWTNATGGAVTVEEVGVFDAAAAGNLIARFTTTDGDFVAQTIPNAGTWDITLYIPVLDSSE